jgi:hypothetical protein
MFLCLSICHSVWLSVGLSVFLSVCLSFILPVCRSVCLSVCLSVCPSDCVRLLKYAHARAPHCPSLICASCVYVCVCVSSVCSVSAQTRALRADCDFPAPSHRNCSTVTSLPSDHGPRLCSSADPGCHGNVQQHSSRFAPISLSRTHHTCLSFLPIH